jgi:hypothetical protein
MDRGTGNVVEVATNDDWNMRGGKGGKKLMTLGEASGVEARFGLEVGDGDNQARVLCVQRNEARNQKDLVVAHGRSVAGAANGFGKAPAVTAEKQGAAVASCGTRLGMKETHISAGGHFGKPEVVVVIDLFEGEEVGAGERVECGSEQGEAVGPGQNRGVRVGKRAWKAKGIGEGVPLDHRESQRVVGEFCVVVRKGGTRKEVGEDEWYPKRHHADGSKHQMMRRVCG